jgi:putative DNA modification/repair radical SAM protein
MIDEKRLAILSDGAKYDVSCSSSGSKRQNKADGIGNACFGGICHSFTQDGRCISLLKILMSNDCHYDCKYCINRCTNNTQRATATPKEICELVIEFYKRNYIEGLFLSSAVVKSPNFTMERLFDTVKMLRTEYHFNGYIHLKGIPSADKLLIERAGFYVDRMSFNIELPTERSLKLLAPQKNKSAIIEPMKMLALDKYYDNPLKLNRRKDFLPAGQTTQMIIGASPENDAHILKLTEFMYQKYKLKRVYYSSYTPTNFDTSLLPYEQAPLLREHRLYQADWLLRFYGFTADEITGTDGNLATEYDPKCAWALKNLGLFPVEINTATPEMLVRVPGIGVKSAYRIMQARKQSKLDFEHLKRLRVVLKRAQHFITCQGKFMGSKSEYAIKNLLINAEANSNAQQLSMIDPSPALSALTGEL